MIKIKNFPPEVRKKRILKKKGKFQNRWNLLITMQPELVQGDHQVQGNKYS